jgi:hypothetical protein
LKLFLFKDKDGKYGYCSAPRVCDVGWTESGKYCHKYIKNPTPMTYEAASLKCAVEGGNLAAIRNAKSQTIIDRIGRKKN